MKLFATGLCAVLLAGCAGLAPPPSSSPSQFPIRQQLAPYRSSFEAAGRLSVNYRKDGNPESISGKFSWSQTPDRIDVSLASAVATIATISITPESATLVQADQQPRVAKDIDSLSAQALGWSLPVAGLRDWLQGYATGADGKRFVASPGNNSVLTADGWRLRFVSWQDNGQDSASTHLAPKRIDAERNAGSFADELAIRIVIDPQG
ncbi:MAG: outer membrane lipoprotein LolB [Massilia sp.]|nr:outer membrane lipoprotein LolB [Massilia sp.]